MLDFTLNWLYLIPKIADMEEGRSFAISANSLENDVLEIEGLLLELILLP